MTAGSRKKVSTQNKSYNAGIRKGQTTIDLDKSNIKLFIDEKKVKVKYLLLQQRNESQQQKSKQKCRGCMTHGR